MNEIEIADVGTLKLNEDHWECWDIATPIGLVDLQVDSTTVEQSTIPAKVKAVFAQIQQVDQLARQFLTDRVPAAELREFGELTEPSLIMEDCNPEGHFTLFYTCTSSPDTVCGVEFREMTPFDLTIGD